MTSPLRPSPAAHFYRRALPAYWIFLAVVTHLPKLKLPAQAPPLADKYIHAAAYAVLAWLAWQCAATYKTRYSPWFVVKLGVVLSGYAALDELTQPLVNRSGDWVDWIFDVAGVVAVLTVMELRRIWRSERAAG